MKETKTNLTNLHCIFFIYKSFALTTDGVLTDKEKSVITSFMFRWTGQKKDVLDKIISETLTWSQSNIKTINDQVGVMFSMIEHLKKQTDFGVPQREYLLMDIRNIARSDGDFLDQQKNWHDMMAKVLEVDIRISPSSPAKIQKSLNKVKKKKIGFLRER